jgi:XTP/dITP diphosphohydrolase
MKLVVATHNAHKVEELNAILGGQVDGLELLGYDGPEPIEDGSSFLENALIKARAAYAHTGLPSMADDSGIAVEILGGAPGIFSARWAGGRDNVQNRRCRFVRVHNRTGWPRGRNQFYGHMAWQRGF